MLLERNGGKGSVGNHWESTILQNDIMASSATLGEIAWTGVNNALI